MESDKVPIEASATPVANGHGSHKSPEVTEVTEVRAGHLSLNAHASSEDSVDAEVLGEAFTAMENKKTVWYAYVTTKDFWILLAIGQVMSLLITATNTFSTLLVIKGTSIPAFQTMFNYVLLGLIYTPITIYRYGPKKYGKVLVQDGWKYFILSFFDVQGNYFTVLAYRYTNILSAQLINFWAIIIVVGLSFLVLKVRYKWIQILGIVICIGGMGVLISSDHITGVNGGDAPSKLKGDLFCAVGATCYGLSNVVEEWVVSKRPMYEAFSLLAICGIIINGITAAIFDRNQFAGATWDGEVAGYLVGFTLCLTAFYSLAPIVFRMGSAAYFNISLLTGSFWGVAIGVKLFGFSIHFMYPIAFVLIILGLIVYYVTGGAFGESKKPWLGENQEAGVSGIGTAKRKAIREAQREGIAGRV